ncbi:carbohydrate ABC transporter membrane protein 2 (CUT1 family) [Kineothrix alysoides]|uniref:Carbohydrate ABC transporter membrane protein 2 (CUT1 family) n=1 Tax=Kineothrix alysoides TaxID=1469948 RepID=A0A4R1R6G8_9FIRM|nr:sugar ABC transporter permease [Kineothrix alysoides]TCL61163.1 carbohydrate ABC transporter membrane protein 2 (CUT1 family) [Kineothrix alysoides]
MGKRKNDVDLENRKARIKNRMTTALIYLELVVVSLIVLLPVTWIVGSSFNHTSSLATSSIIPKNPTLDHYIALFQETDFLKWYGNTLKIAVGNMLASVVVTTLTAYVFSRFRFKGRKGGLMTILVLQMFPSFLGMTAIYILYLNFNLLDNLGALTVTYIAGQIPYNTWLMKGYFDGIPQSLDEAAMLDGASRLRIFYQIIMPLAVPMITFLAVTTFMSPWMDYIFPRLLISSDKNKTLAVGLFEMINGNTNNNFTMFAAGAVMVAVPITILYMCLQKYLIQGITAGANKE